MSECAHFHHAYSPPTDLQQAWTNGVVKDPKLVKEYPSIWMPMIDVRVAPLSDPRP